MPSFTGTSGPDDLTGTTGSDTMQGLDGPDTLTGGDGADWLDGGAGDDRLLGGIGLDTLVGGFGIDQLFGGANDDVLQGGEGDDVLQGDAGADRLEGGDGNDSLQGGDGQDTLDGGAGADTINADDLNVTDFITGGDGDDVITIRFDTVDAGAGDDRINAMSGRVTTGSGHDTVVVDRLGANLVLTDFDPANDVLDISAKVGGLIGYDGNGDPFGSGFFRLVQHGADTLLMSDLDGRSNGESFNTIVTWSNFSGTGLTAQSLGGYAPGPVLRPPVATPMTVIMPAGSVFVGQVSGTDPDGVVLGYAYTNPPYPVPSFYWTPDNSGSFTYTASQYAGEQHFTFFAGDGALLSDPVDVPLKVLAANDTSLTGTVVEAGAAPGVAQVSGAIRASDTNGATGFTVVTGPQYGAFTVNSAGAWTYQLNNSNPTVDALATGQQLTDKAVVLGSGNVFVQIVVQIQGADEVGGPPGVSLMGTAGNDTLVGGRGPDTLVGGAGDDALDGAAGADVMTGGAGADSFQLTTDGSVDSIDFNGAQGDHLLLVDSPGVITDGSAGVLTLNRGTGMLSWDPDNAGPRTSINLATMSGAETLTKASLLAGFQPSVIRTVGADGSRVEVVYDWGSQSFDSATSTYDAGGNLLTYDVRFDNGGQSLRTNDVAGTHADWASVVAEYNGQGQLFAYSVFHDDGSRTLWLFDVANTMFYSRVVEEYDALGRLSQQAAASDDGTAYERHYDTYDTQPWAYYHDSYRADGLLLSHTFYNADGSVFVG